MANNGKLQSSTMVSLDIKNYPGAWRGPPISGEAAEIGNRVLQLNHDKFHPFFSYMDRRRALPCKLILLAQWHLLTIKLESSHTPCVNSPQPRGKP